MTRPIDDYMHRKLKDPTTRIQSNEDLKFAHMIKELLSDAASSINQSRINNLQKLMELPDKVPQLVESTVKPLVKKKQLNVLLADKKLPIRSVKNKRSLFCLRQQTAFGTTSTTAHTPQNATQYPSIRTEIWGNYLSQITRSLREALVSLTDPNVASVKSISTDPTESSTLKNSNDNNNADVENQRRTLQKEGPTDLALDLITDNTRSVKIRSRYYSTQKDFMDW
ncbi:hypothetical protein BB561_004148 [Smittium simulii]|uniref:Uncharacterized protein n=1 Tax=Smittium simulii TaxID=133385 RepID=A0A2T9YHT0_9FUNG|nr:hypothetical protein BB561_004148 [Smittium simulii]